MCAVIKRSFVLFLTCMIHTFYLLEAATIDHLHPPFGPSAGGNSVTIKGSGFSDATAVNFGIYPASAFVVQSDQVIVATAPPGSIGNRTVTVTTPSGNSSEAPQALYTFQNDWTAYVTNPSSATVNAIDVSTNTVTATIGGEIEQPARLAINGNNVYVTAVANATVLVIDRTSNTIIANIPVGNSPVGIAINPAKTKAYVTNSGSNNVSVIDLASNLVIQTIPVGQGPSGIAITPNGQKAIVANSVDGSVSVIDLATNSVTPILGIANAFGVAIHPSGLSAFVTQGVGAGKFVEIDTTTNAIVGLAHSTFGSAARNIVVNAAGNKIYIANSTNVAVINYPGFGLDTQIVDTGRPFDLKITPAGDKLYVTLANSGTVKIIKLSTNSIIPPTIAVGQAPTGIDFTSDGSQSFVANQSSNTISVIDVISDQVGATISGKLFSPVGLAINPENTCSYVADRTRVSVIDLATHKVLDPINIPGATNVINVALSKDGSKACAIDQVSPVGTAYLIDLGTRAVTPIKVGDSPLGVAFNPNGKTVYVANFNDNTLSVIDVATNSVTDVIILNGGLFGARVIAVTPDGSLAYVSNNANSSNLIGVFDQVDVIDLTNNTLLTSITVGIAPEGVAITPDGKMALVANTFGDPSIPSSPSISIIDIPTNSVIKTINLDDNPLNISILPDGSQAYISIRDPLGQGSVIVLDLTSFAIGNPIPVGKSTYAVVITPDPAPVASFSSPGGKTNQTLSFDATTSRTAVGTIASYHWDFGDGQSTTTSNPIITHTYATPGSFTVTLTVVNSAGTSTTQIFTGQTLTRHGGPSAIFQQTLQILPEILPPRHLEGIQQVNRFATQADYVNRITWKAPRSDNLPVLYRIYRDASLTKLLATIPADDKLRFVEHNRKKHKAYTYFVVSVDSFGSVSVPAKVTVEPR